MYNVFQSKNTKKLNKIFENCPVKTYRKTLVTTPQFCG